MREFPCFPFAAVISVATFGREAGFKVAVDPLIDGFDLPHGSQSLPVRLIVYGSLFIALRIAS